MSHEIHIPEIVADALHDRRFRAGVVNLDDEQLEALETAIAGVMQHAAIIHAPREFDRFRRTQLTVMDKMRVIRAKRAVEKALEPYIKRLCEIDAIYMPAMRISVDDAARMQIEVVELRDPQS